MFKAEFYEETIAKLREDLEQSKKRCRKSTKSLESIEQNIYDLNLEMTLLQANHKQTVEQVTMLSSFFFRLCCCVLFLFLDIILEMSCILILLILLWDRKTIQDNSITSCRNVLCFEHLFT